MNLIKNLKASLFYSKNKYQYVHDDFVGKKTEIDETIIFFESKLKEVSSQIKTPVVIFQGEGGNGKTLLCKEISSIMNSKKLKTIDIYDLNDVGTHSILSLIQHVSECVADNGFKLVLDKLTKYKKSIEFDKVNLYREIQSR